MARAIGDIEKKRGRGRPPTDATPIMLRLPPDLLAFIDRLRERGDPVPSRPEAIRQALERLRKMEAPTFLERYPHIAKMAEAHRAKKAESDE